MVAAGLLRSRSCEILDQFLSHLLIGQAKLGVLSRSLAVDLAEPFRMLGEVLLGRDQGIERVHESLIDVLAAALGVEPVGLAVALVPHGPVPVERVEPERRAILQRRHVLGTSISPTLIVGFFGIVLSVEDHQRQPNWSSRKV